jgi:hypothetical protein
MQHNPAPLYDLGYSILHLTATLRIGLTPTRLPVLTTWDGLLPLKRHAEVQMWLQFLFRIRG